MWRTSLAWQRSITAALEPVGLTHSQFVILSCTAWLEEHSGSSNQAMIAAQAGMDVKTVSQVLRRLEQAGLVSRQQAPNDARARIVRTTVTGRDVGDRATRLVEDTDDAYFAGMPHLRSALLQDAGPRVRGPQARHLESRSVSSTESPSSKNEGDTTHPTTTAATWGSGSG